MSALAITGKGIWGLLEPVGSQGGFTEREAWGDTQKLSGFVLWVLWTLRQETGWPIKINEGCVSRASGRHPAGEAVDWCFVGTERFSAQVARVEQVLDEYQIGDRMGLGIYPGWRTPGFHTDVRGTKARWGWIGQMVDGQKIYCGFDEALQYSVNKEAAKGGLDGNAQRNRHGTGA